MILHPGREGCQKVPPHQQPVGSAAPAGVGLLGYHSSRGIRPLCGLNPGANLFDPSGIAGNPGESMDLFRT